MEVLVQMPSQTVVRSVSTTEECLPAIQARVACFIHYAHATLADLFEQLVVAECPVRHERPGGKYT